MENDHSIKTLSGLYKDWFLDYASYVILDRAIPHIDDGLKPVQRRILHSLEEIDDGRYNKVANVIGNTMKYHPHGDASINDALVQLGQKDVLIDRQGNWGEQTVGDSAAAARYIEARLTEFAKEVVFNPKITEWQLSYDGRNKEPITLPIRFPLLLLQGADGIAVGLSTKILPHNFNELLDAAINILQEKEFSIYPDFMTGGEIDVSDYKDGERGGKVKIRAKIEIKDTKTLRICEIPYSTNTGALIESIVSANDKGKIKIKKIEDNTAKNIEIILHLAGGVSPDITIDALYAFTQCEISLSPNCCVIVEEKPKFISVKEALIHSTRHTTDLLEQDLKIELGEVSEKKFFSSLEKIFIEEKIYRQLEAAENEEHALDIIDHHITPFKHLLERDTTREDYLKLLEVRIKRITKYDSGKADELIAKYQSRIEELQYSLAHIIDYTIEYYKRIKKKYGKGRERRTLIKTFDKVDVAQVVISNQKLYVNRKEGFVGYGLKKDEYICDCSDLDDIIVFLKDGTCKVVRIADKTFVGKNIIHVAVFQKEDNRTTYNMIYVDKGSSVSYIKRFNVIGVTRDKDYHLAGNPETNKVLYFSVNPNGEAEKVKVELKPLPNIRKLEWEIDFSDIQIKGRGVLGNIVAKNPILKITLAEKGQSTLGKLSLYFDPKFGRLNYKEEGILIGDFSPAEKVVFVSKKGHYRTVTCEPVHRLDEEWVYVNKFEPDTIFTVAYYEGEKQQSFIKRFTFEEISNDKIGRYISEHPDSKVLLITDQEKPIFNLDVLKGKAKRPDTEQIEVESFISVKGISALGNRLSQSEVKKIVLATQNN